MLKLLLVAYEFPPYGGIGVQRVLKFCKYLPEFGIEPVVFTKAHQTGYVRDDNNVAATILNKIKVYHHGGEALARYHELKHERKIKRHPYYYYLGLRYIWYIDFFSVWYFDSRKELLRIAKTEQVDAVFTTAPPFSVHFFGAYLKQHLDLPWVADMRDPLNAYGRTRSLVEKIQLQFGNYYERRFSSLADKITVVSPPMRDNAIKRLGAAYTDKFVTITNGYDPDDFIIGSEVIAPDERFVVTYTGGFRERSRTSRQFVNALLSLVEQQRIEAAKVLLRFVGYIEEHERVIIEELALHGIGLVFTGFISYQQALGYQQSGNALLLIATSICSAEASEMFTGKVFEYLHAGKPIFALAPDGPLKSLIERGGFGTVVSPCDVDDIADGFEAMYRQWLDDGISYMPDEKLKQQYHRKTLTGQLAELVKQITADKTQ
jgi:glycosyltransferase involved in cell wall biosynthesis